MPYHNEIVKTFIFTRGIIYEILYASEVLMKTLNIVLVLILGLLVSACNGGGGSSTSSAAPALPVAEIFVYGDEISAGNGVTTSYVDLIESETGMPVVNKSRSSLGSLNNTLSLANDDLDDVGSEDIVIIFVGYQDVRWHGTVPNGDLTSFVEPFLDRAFISGAHVYVVNPIRMNAAVYGSFAPYNNGSDALMLAFSNTMENYIDSYSSSRMSFIDLQSVFNPIAGNLQGDMQLPNETGHAIIADTILNGMGF